ncbi:hypothetical protein FHR83_005878 [Actinoplanes campanulatus]|uniref:Uncharacterized protein n=1 Tax=Actinoplanes campanulatus TaxID=113559 RepID=A0A7W5FH13_9ACTN|nr:hypothetical protein [Actinoplanes campanulatus]MBB3098183.1 hypothetical protein [Actinoplanes campanulatus]GGN35058.1 hypothetical protein GCM10010109_58720 [Actinoplanes campanulatus]GID38857.1 hypothetical protein Aca09nite_53630 [Actinoplanes campanulatus]
MPTMVAPGSHVRLDEAVQPDWVGVVDGAVPGGEVEQAGAGERVGEVEEPPALAGDVQAGGVELGVHPAPRGDSGAFGTFAGGFGKGVQQVGDVVGACGPSALISQPQ